MTATASNDDCLFTPWTQGDPPMIGWWDTVIITAEECDINDVEAQVKLCADKPSFRRWWGGPISGWSIAVTPYYQGLELSRIALMRFRPDHPNTSVILYRGLLVPAKLKDYRYKLGQHYDVPDEVRHANKDLVYFESEIPKQAKSEEVAGKTRIRVAVESEQMQLSIEFPKSRVRVEDHSAPAAYRKQRVQVTL